MALYILYREMSLENPSFSLPCPSYPGCGVACHGPALPPDVATILCPSQWYLAQTEGALYSGVAESENFETIELLDLGLQGHWLGFSCVAGL